MSAQQRTVTYALQPQSNTLALSKYDCKRTFGLTSSSAAPGYELQ